MDDRRSILFHWALLGASELAGKLAGFAATLLIVWNYSTADFGILTLVATIVGIALIIARGGLDVIAVRQAAENPSALPAMIPTFVGLRLILALAVYGLMLSLCQVAPGSAPITNLLALGGLSLFTGAVGLTWTAQGAGRMDAFALANFAVQALNLLFVAIAVWAGLGLASLVLALVLSETLVAISLAAWSVRVFGSWTEPFPRKRWTRIARDAAPIGLASILRAIALSSDILLLGYFLSHEDVGLYAGAYKLFQLGLVASALYFAVLFPALARRSLGDPRQVWSDTGRLLRVISPLALVGGVVAALFAEATLRALFGATFAAAGTAFVFLIFALVASFVASHFRNALILTGSQRLDLKMIAASCTVHIVLKGLLIPLYGIAGASAATLVGEMALLILGFKTAFAARKLRTVALGGGGR